MIKIQSVVRDLILKEFEAYIPAGIANLREALGKFPEYPALADLTAQAALVIGLSCLPEPAAR